MHFLRKVRDYFHREDEIVRVAAGLLEPEAEMWREMLENEGVPAFTKIIDPISLSDGWATGVNTAIFVRREDVERAREIMGSRMETPQ
jgi:hypothetical protein